MMAMTMTMMMMLMLLASVVLMAIMLAAVLTMRVVMGATTIVAMTTKVASTETTIMLFPWRQAALLEAVPLVRKPTGLKCPPAWPCRARRGFA